MKRIVTNVAIVLMMAAGVGASQSMSPLADAAMRGDKTAVAALIKDGVDVGAAQGDGMTALHWAAERGNAEIAEMLVYAGANGALKGNLHIKAAEGTPMANAFLSMGHILGMDMKTFGDSTGELSLTQASPATVA